MLKVKIKNVNLENFKEYGSYISMPQGNADVMADNLKYWHDIYKSNLGDSDITLGFLSVLKQEMVVKELEQHQKYGEIFVTVKGEGVLIVAKNKDSKPDIESIDFFILKAGDAVLLNKNIWHLPPLPYTESMDFLMVLSVNILDDMTKVKIPHVKL